MSQNQMNISGPTSADALLGAGDPHPVEWVNRAAVSPILLVCEHAGQAVPQALGGLGVSQGAIDGHIGWDIGAETVARAVAARLDAPLILQRYSRLVIDCNRPPRAIGSIPEISGGTPIPANTGLTTADVDARQHEIFDPFDAALADGFVTHPRHAVFSIHSFTRHFQGKMRIWDAGFLARKDTETAPKMMDVIAQKAPNLLLALNEPYQLDDASDWFIPRYAEARDMRHCLIEICNDHLCDPAGIDRWADLISAAITASVPDSG